MWSAGRGQERLEERERERQRAERTEIIGIKAAG